MTTASSAGFLVRIRTEYEASGWIASASSVNDFTHTEQVRFRDLDPMGHVNNAVFLTYLEQARVDFFAQAGAATQLEDMNMVVARVEIDFKAPVRLGQTVDISVRASRFGTKSFDLDYELRVQGELIAEARSVQVAYDYERREPVEVPADWREKLAAVAA
jgi:acyl-CoA thioester hydrolase